MDKSAELLKLAKLYDLGELNLTEVHEYYMHKIVIANDGWESHNGGVYAELQHIHDGIETTYEFKWDNPDSEESMQETVRALLDKFDAIITKHNLSLKIKTTPSAKADAFARVITPLALRYFTNETEPFERKIMSYVTESLSAHPNLTNVNFCTSCSGDMTIDNLICDFCTETDRIPCKMYFKFMWDRSYTEGDFACMIEDMMQKIERYKAACEKELTNPADVPIAKKIKTSNSDEDE